MDNFIEITTFEQLKFHLNNGEVICFHLSDADGYIIADKEHDHKVILQRPFNQAEEFISGDLESWFVEIKESTPFYVIKGLKLQSRKTSIFRRIIGWFYSKFNRL